MLNLLLNYLKDKKSYLMSFVLVLYAVSGYFTGHLNLFDALGLVFGAGTVSALRGAIGKLQLPVA